jgi:hypothetical protein
VNKPVVAFKTGELYTLVPVAEPHDPDRRWKLLAQSTVLPIAETGVAGRYCKMVKQLTDKEWHFSQRQCHLLRYEMFEQLNYAHFGNELPMFVQFPSTLIWDEQQVVGFVTHTTRIVQTSGGPGVTVKMHIPKLIDPTSTPNPRAATTFSKPIAQRFHFPSSSSKGIIYDTIVYTDKTVSCNCPGWTRHNARSCKHVKDPSVISYVKRMK